MAPPKEELLDDPPTKINPYKVLGVEEKATADQIKSAYRKQALKYHPDKASPSEKESANKRFQEIAFAYAVLSDERRRKRYDTTGNTSESLDLDDDDFNWADYFREQYSEVLTVDTLDKIKKEYQGSDEERRDLLDVFERFKGDLDKVYGDIMCSNVLDDDERFRAILDQAIEDGEVQGWNKYVYEPEKKKEHRRKKAEQEAQEAEELAEELGVSEKLGRGKGKKKKDEGMGDLAALIQQRQKGRAENFFENLKAKYGGGKKNGKKRSTEDEPPEEAFHKTAAKAKKGRK